MRTAVVTGAAQGIGRATAMIFHADGYQVLGIDLNVSASPYEIIATDLYSKDDPMLQSLSHTILERLDGRVDVLVNNAAYQKVVSLEQMSEEDWNRTMAVNVSAPLWLTKNLLSGLKKQRGAVVNVASIHANLTKTGFSLYAAGKGALISLTRSLALELAPDVRVNAVLPAATRTPMLEDGFRDNPTALTKLGSFHPLERIAEASEIAEVIRFLCEEKSSFVTGASWSVDGGIGSLLHDPEGRHGR